MLRQSTNMRAAMAATFVYVSNADDGDIGVYRLRESELQTSGAGHPRECQRQAGKRLQTRIRDHRQLTLRAGVRMQHQPDA